MANFSFIVAILTISLHAVDIFSILIYCVLMISISGFRKLTNLFALNIAISILLTNIYLMVYFTMFIYDFESLFVKNTCALVLYMGMMSKCQATYSIILFAIHRFCLVTFPMKHFFKTTRWTILAVSVQWSISFLISIPSAHSQPVSIDLLM